MPNEAQPTIEKPPLRDKRLLNAKTVGGVLSVLTAVLIAVGLASLHMLVGGNSPPTLELPSAGGAPFIDEGFTPAQVTEPAEVQPRVLRPHDPSVNVGMGSGPLGLSPGRGQTPVARTPEATPWSDTAPIPSGVDRSERTARSLQPPTPRYR